ncbi:zinc-binding dehydrogenase [Pseudonocardia acaciae]|uniref:zinc-binding dehydrogenase n=1 Tax=Pseudonocardia acaciae TaxID=551276 RepID=UPI00048D75B2|nr:alcohol dehydrogenase catalytic domain-containing protein [Pseudonocardia acaciae]
MRAVVYDRFGVEPDVRTVDDPVPTPHGAVIRVAATGLCRSDWHGWQGRDAVPIPLPHVPGHELAGTVAAVGAEVTGWRAGSRVTVPFVCACGRCATCALGEQQICERQTQPGFSHWGSFAEYVLIENADLNLVGIPAELSMHAAAALGCRFATSFRAVVTQARVAPGEWLAVHGCGGIGLSAVMIAAAAGAQVVAVDVARPALELARKFGAAATVDASAADDVAEAVIAATGGGAHVSIDALGSEATCVGSINCLRRQGRHVQLGVMPDPPPVPMHRVMGYELAILGSHGMAARAYPPMLDLITAGRLRPDLMITKTIGLDDAPAALVALGSGSPTGVTVIEP